MKNRKKRTRAGEKLLPLVKPRRPFALPPPMPHKDKRKVTKHKRSIIED